MSTRTLSIAQWVGVLGGALAWTAQHVAGYGIGEARCSAAAGRFGISYGAWELAALGAAVLVVVAAEACAVAVFARTRGANYGDGPEEEAGEVRVGRLHFFATAALVANVLFLAIPLLDAVAAVGAPLCVQS